MKQSHSGKIYTKPLYRWASPMSGIQGNCHCLSCAHSQNLGCLSPLTYLNSDIFFSEQLVVKAEILVLATHV